MTEAATTTEEKPAGEAAPTDATNKEVVAAIKEVKEALASKGESNPTPQEIRDAIKEKTGFTDAQLDMVQQMSRASTEMSGKKVAELQEKVAWSEFKDDHGGRIDPAVEKLMKEELKAYDVSSRGDKVLLRKVYLLAKGTLAETSEKARKADPANNDKANGSDNIIGRRAMGQPGSADGLETGVSKGKGGDGLTDQEKDMADRMHIKHEDYEKAKSTKIVSQLKGSK